MNIQSATPLNKSLEAYVRDAPTQDAELVDTIRFNGRDFLQHAQDYLLQPHRSPRATTSIVENMRDVTRALQGAIDKTSEYSYSGFPSRLAVVQAPVALAPGRTEQVDAHHRTIYSAESFSGAQMPQADPMTGVGNFIRDLNAFTTQYAVMAAIPHPTAIVAGILHRDVLDSTDQTASQGASSNRETDTSSRWIFRPHVHTSQAFEDHSSSSTETVHVELSEGDKRLDAVRTIQELKERLYHLRTAPGNIARATVSHNIQSQTIRRANMFPDEKLLDHSSTCSSRDIGPVEYQPQHIYLP